MVYKIVRCVIEPLFLLIFHPRIEGIENVDRTGSFILAGNHTNNLDCLLLITVISRPIHFLGKHTLFKGFKKYIMRAMRVIPVDRTAANNKNAREEALQVLNRGEVVGIFPEGTINRTTKTTLPFKIGTVYLSIRSQSPIVPFVIEGSYNPFKKDLKITFLPAFVAKGNLSCENDKFMQKICEKLERGKNENAKISKEDRTTNGK